MLKDAIEKEKKEKRMRTVKGTFMAMRREGRLGLDVPLKRRRPDRGIAKEPITTLQDTVRIVTGKHSW